MSSRRLPLLLTLLALSGAATTFAVTSSHRSAAPAAGGHSKLVYPGSSGKLVYKPWDERGDTVLDFSNCGYGSGGVALPDALVKATVTPEGGSGDDTARIQAAIDTVARLPQAKDGLRGAVLLKKGMYRLSKPLRIAASGVVLRGEGKTAEGTFLLGTFRDQKPLIEVRGARGVEASGGSRVVDEYVPVGSRTLRVAGGGRFQVGNTVLVRRNGNADWIHTLRMDQIVPRGSNPESTKQWSPFTLEFDRVITAVNGDRITLDAPISCAIDSRWGGGDVVAYTDPGRIARVGVENLYGESVFDKNKKADTNDGRHNMKPYYSDEDHATYIVSFDNVKNAWARDLSARYLAQGVAIMNRGAKWITVQDCSSVDPISVITGGRRYTYNISGQLCLVQRCYARDARHAFIVAGSHTCGPNVFLDCKADDNHATSEPHQRWSVGGLYDNVSAPMAIQDRQWMGSGHGWAGANFVVWNSTGSLTCQQPPTAQNFAIGFVGKKERGAFDRPEGWWESLGTHVAPHSLYQAQLADRLGK